MLMETGYCEDASDVMEVPRYWEVTGHYRCLTWLGSDTLYLKDPWLLYRLS